MGSLPLAPGHQLCPPAAWGAPAALAGPREMLYINVNFPPSRAPSFNKLSGRRCQSNFSHFVSLFSVWGNPVSPRRGGLAAGKVQLCRLADRPTRQAHRREAGPAAWAGCPRPRRSATWPRGWGVGWGGGESLGRRAAPHSKGWGVLDRWGGGEGGLLCLGPCLPDLGHPQRAPGPSLTPLRGTSLGPESRHHPPPAPLSPSYWLGAHLPGGKAEA